MTYRVVTELRFSDRFQQMTETEQQAEQLAALDIVARNGGAVVDTIVVPGDQVALVQAQYPDETAALKAHLQIGARGAYLLTPKRAYTLEEWTAIADAAKAEAVIGV